MKHATRDSEKEDESTKVRRQSTEQASDRSNIDNSVASLHRAVGNQAVQGLHESRDLEVSQPGDPSEREAERVAKEMTMGTSPAYGSGVHEIINRMATDHKGKGINGETSKRIASLEGRGRPLSTSVQSFFEPRFGHDFGDVRIHDGMMASRVAKSLDATAFTIGRNVAFADRRFRPEDPKGRELLAHELTHVVQQSSHTTPVVQRQSNENSSVPDVKKLKEGDSIPLEEYVSAEGIKNAPFNVVAFLEGLFEGSSLSWSEIQSIIMRAYDPRELVHIPSYLTGITRGVYNAVQDYADLITNIDEFVGVVIEMVMFLIFDAQPSDMKRLGRGISSQYSSKLKRIAKLEGEQFWIEMGEFVGPIVVDLALSAIGVGLAGKAAKIGKKLAGILPERLVKKANNFVKLPNRKKPPDAERPKWHSETDEIEYRDKQGNRESPVERQKKRVDVQKLKSMVVERWTKAIADDAPERPVKVVPRADREYSDSAKGYITELKYVRGASPRRMEEILGLPEGKLTGKDQSGAIVQILSEAPDPADIKLKGTTLHPGGENMRPDQMPYLKGDGVPQWEATKPIPVDKEVPVGLTDAFNW